MRPATLFLAATLVATCLASPGQGLPAESLVPSLANPGFELCTEADGVGPCPAGDLPDFWHQYYPDWLPWYRGPEEWTSDNARTGIGALRITDQGAFTLGWAGITSTRVPLASPLLAGQTLEASAWMKAESGHGNMGLGLFIRWFDADGELLNAVGSYFGPTADWTQHVVRGLIPAAAAEAAILFYSCSPCGYGTWLVDDVDLALVLPDRGVA